MHTDEELKILDRYLRMLKAGLPRGGIDRMIAEVEARIAECDVEDAELHRSVLEHYREIRTGIQQTEERFMCILAERMDSVSE